jgi:hypothetical protein
MSRIQCIELDGGKLINVGVVEESVTEIWIGKPAGNGQSATLCMSRDDAIKMHAVLGEKLGIKEKARDAAIAHRRESEVVIEQLAEATAKADRLERELQASRDERMEIVAAKNMHLADLRRLVFRE